MRFSVQNSRLLACAGLAHNPRPCLGRTPRTRRLWGSVRSTPSRGRVLAFLALAAEPRPGYRFQTSLRDRLLADLTHSECARLIRARASSIARKRRLSVWCKRIWSSASASALAWSIRSSCKPPAAGKSTCCNGSNGSSERKIDES
jgi:hypothetical protein